MQECNIPDDLPTFITGPNDRACNASTYRTLSMPFTTNKDERRSSKGGRAEEEKEGRIAEVK
jgi:hypothetical protein